MIRSGMAARVAENLRVTTTLNVQWNASPSLSLDVRWFQRAQPGRAGLIILHAGGWLFGDKSSGGTGDSATRTAQVFAALGHTTFNANYLLTGGVPATILANVRALVTWYRNNAATYNADPAKLVLFGLSAGGHLALMTAITGAAGSTRPEGVVAWSPPCELATLVDVGASAAADFMGVPNTAPNLSAYQLYSPRQQLVAPICPLRLVCSDSEVTTSAGIPRTQIDNLHTQALAVGGQDSTKRVLAGAVHATFTGQTDTGGGVNGVSDVYESLAWIAAKVNA